MGARGQGRHQGQREGFLTVAEAFGSLPGACFAARRAEARWPLTTLPLARQDITAAVEGTVWARTPARRARTFELKRPRQWCGALCQGFSKTQSGCDVAWMRC